jgi:hypothetical protein
MATGQNAFIATLYGEVTSYDKLNGGYQLAGNGYAQPVYRSFPVELTQVVAITPAQVYATAFGSVTANSVIEVFPQGLGIPGFSRKYLCDATIATLNGLRT